MKRAHPPDSPPCPSRNMRWVQRCTLRYGWSIPNTPQSCICRNKFEVHHALRCKRGGFMIHRHNELWDFTASLLTEVCHNVAIEPKLQPLDGETLQYRSANTDTEARLDVRARGFWNQGQDAYFDIRVFNPNAPSYCSQDLHHLYRKHEQEKKREYNGRVLEIENGVFTPLVFSTSGGIGRDSTMFYKRLADSLSRKRDKPYTQWLWDGCDAASILPCFALLFYASGAPDPLDTTLCRNPISHQRAERNQTNHSFFPFFYVSFFFGSYYLISFEPV